MLIWSPFATAGQTPEFYVTGRGSTMYITSPYNKYWDAINNRVFISGCGGHRYIQSWFGYIPIPETRRPDTMVVVTAGVNKPEATGM